MNPFGKLIGLFVSCVLVIVVVAAGPAVWWFDRHFAGVSYKIGFPILFHYTFTLAPGPVLAERAKTADALRQRDAALATTRVCSTVLTTQNSRIQALSARGVIAHARADLAVQPHLAAMAAAPAKSATIAAALTGLPPASDECAKAEAVDRSFVETLR